MGPEKKRWGDRKDGWQVKSLDAFCKFVPFVMETRNDANNLFMEQLDIAAAEKYIREKREQGLAGFGMLHIFIAAYVRTVSQRPWINRFVAGHRIYARRKIEISLAVKKEMSSDSEESTIKMVFEPTDTAVDVYNKLAASVEDYRREGGSEDNKTLKTANMLTKMPRPILRVAMRFIKWLDYHGWLPQSLLDASPFHASLFISNLASLGIPPVYHHLYNFGNIPVFVTFGAKRKELELDADGSVKEKRVIDFTVVTDERICDGFYYARAFKMFKQFMRKPEVLDLPPEKVEEDLR